MTATAAAITARSSPGERVPPLINGDQLTRAEFERRYRATPNVNKAELIEGIVYMPSPVRANRHGNPHSLLNIWLGLYLIKTPGLLIYDNATTRLDGDNEPQPDVMLMIPQHAGGSARIDEDDYVSGAPELVGEIAASSVSIDLHAKLNAYRRNGVREYLVWRTEDQAIDWFILRPTGYVQLPADHAGMVRSETFPGLALEPAALLAGDLPRLFALLDRTATGDEHAAFVRRLKA